jgi:hypothetical protein
MSRPSPSASEIEQAKRNTAVARARVQTSVGALKERLHPKALAADAAETVRAKTSAVGDRARQRPVAAGAVAGVAALILFRKPLGKVLRRLFSRSDRLARRQQKEALQADRERRRAEKEARRAEKRARREAAKQRDEAPPKDETITRAAPASGAA